MRQERRAIKIGDVYDVWWEVISMTELDESQHYKATLRNTANGQEVTITDCTMRKIANGQTSVSKSIASKINAKKVLKERPDAPYFAMSKRKWTRKYYDE